MASRVVVPEQHRVGGGKQKNEEAERINKRRVLRDIGNLAIGPPVEPAKPRHHITRRTFGSQLLANAQAATHKNNYKNVSNNNLIGKDKKEVDVIVISSDEEEEDQKCKIGRKPSNKHQNRTLTSILTARSKAASSQVAKKSNDMMLIADIDALDMNNELAAVEYIEDMHTFYKLTENDGRVHDYMGSQMDINSKMRAILVDWLIEVHRKFELMPESLYLTVNIVDRFLSMKSVSRRELQLVGISSMLIACKYEEIWAPEVSEFIAISDNAYVREQVLVMEKAILGKLEWYLTVPTPYVFLVRYIKASSGADDKEMENMAFFLGEGGLTSYSTIVRYCPSMIAACAVYAARCTLGKSPLWTETLKYHTGYSEDQLMECSKVLVGFHRGAAESNQRAVYRKYSNAERGSVALFPPARSLLLATTDQELIR